MVSRRDELSREIALFTEDAGGRNIFHAHFCNRIKMSAESVQRTATGNNRTVFRFGGRMVSFVGLSIERSLSIARRSCVKSSAKNSRELFA